jgi:excisionase family DNA binding protein
MPRTEKPRTHALPGTKGQGGALNGPPDAVLTLAEAAAYLRFPETDVLHLVDQQGLPARRLGNEWRFLKAAIQRWLGMCQDRSKEGIWNAAGTLKDDPYLDEMLQVIERMRGRPTTEED